MRGPTYCCVMNKPFWLFIFTVLTLGLGIFSIIQTRRVRERDATIRDLSRMAHDYERLVDGLFGGEPLPLERLSRLEGDFEISDLDTIVGYPGYLLRPQGQVPLSVPTYLGLELRTAPGGQLRDVSPYKP